MKKLLVFLFLIMASAVMAESPINILTASGSKAVGTHPTLADPMPVDARITSATISIPVNVLPAYNIPGQVATNAYLDTDKRQLVNLASITASLALAVASTTIGTFTTAVTTIGLKTGTTQIRISLTQQNKEAWLLMGGADPSVGNGEPFRSSVVIPRLNPSDIIKVIASESLGYAETQR